MKKRIKFTILDGIILLVIALAVFAVPWFLSSRTPDGEPVWVYFTFEARNLRSSFSGPEEGHIIYDSVRGHRLGEVAHFETLPATMFTQDLVNGHWTEELIPDQIDARITIRAAAFANEHRILIAYSNVEIRVGQQMYIRGRGYAAGGFTVALNIEPRD
ncbi:MAG: DUF4330 domain-containing protein [Defluviitaleaceae bacterium]|nr:DUF4330 domain-containing protein [Defluviitaleaceae bacterium]